MFTPQFSSVLGPSTLYTPEDVEFVNPSVINQDLFSPNQDQIAFTISHVLNQD